MRGAEALDFLRRICGDMDAGRTPRPSLRRLVAPFVVPAAIGLAGCAASGEPTDPTIDQLETSDAGAALVQQDPAPSGQDGGPGRAPTDEQQLQAGDGGPSSTRDQTPLVSDGGASASGDQQTRTGDAGSAATDDEARRRQELEARQRRREEERRQREARELELGDEERWRRRRQLPACVTDPHNPCPAPPYAAPFEGDWDTPSPNAAPGRGTSLSANATALACGAPFATA